MRVKTKTKRQAIINAAGKLFLCEGYAATSMVAVAAAVGSSRVTVYGYFPTKESLFEAFVIETGREHFEALNNTALSPGTTLKMRLESLGINYLLLLVDNQVIAINRLIIGESKRFPELARIFYDSGPRPVFDRVENILSKEIEKKAFKEIAPRILAAHFLALCGAELKEIQLWGLAPKPTLEAIQATASTAVEAFLNGYGA